MNDDEAWRKQAACRGQTDLMFGPWGHRPTSSERWALRGLSLCRECPVVRECRDWALRPDDPAYLAIAGGLTWRQRLKLLKTRRMVSNA